MLAILRCSFVVLLVLSSLPASAAPRRAVDFSPGDVVGNFFDGNDRVVGWKFRVGPQDLTVTSLGFYDAGGDGLVESHPVAIYRESDQALIGIDQVEAGTFNPLRGAFRMEDVIPFQLQAGESYVIATLLLGNGDPWIWIQAAGGVGVTSGDSQIDPAIIAGEAVGGRFECCTATALVFPTQGLNDIRTLLLGPTFEFEPTPLPVPSLPGRGWWLLGATLLAAGLLGARRLAA